METFKIFVLGEFGSETTTFVRTVCYDNPRRQTHPYNFGRILTGDEGVAYFFAWSRNFSIQSLIETLEPSTIKENADLGQMFELFSLSDFSKTGIILIIDSADPELDEANKNLLQNIHYLMQYKKIPYVVALSNQHLPGARLSRQMREALAIPDHIKALGCDLKAPSSAAHVVIEVLNLMPPNAILQRLIEDLEVYF